MTEFRPTTAQQQLLDRYTPVMYSIVYQDIGRSHYEAIQLVNVKCKQLLEGPKPSRDILVRSYFNLTDTVNLGLQHLEGMRAKEITSSIFDGTPISLELFATHLDLEREDKTATIDKNVTAYEEALKKTKAYRQQFWDLAPATEQEIKDNRNLVATHVTYPKGIRSCGKVEQIGLVFCVLALAYMIQNFSFRTLF
ncbi:hypothetical protein [Simkania sp.]|uniref:hypothetical protein n=1 Tax=Simkania sp. TaxID=34094 RepID=UPI003B51E05D